jgi:hypothetical protein
MRVANNVATGIAVLAVAGGVDLAIRGAEVAANDSLPAVNRAIGGTFAVGIGGFAALTGTQLIRSGSPAVAALTGAAAVGGALLAANELPL